MKIEIQDIFSRDGFQTLTRAYLLASYRSRFWETVTWKGVRCLQYAEDLLAISEAFFQVRPQVFIEVGTMFGGGILFYDTLMAATNPTGRIVGVDVYTAEAQSNAISRAVCDTRFVRGDSKDPATIEQVRGLIPAGAPVMVLLDSDHSAAHVEAEIRAYAPLVTPGSYLVVMDGAMRELSVDPANPREWFVDNPSVAVERFLAGTQEFQQDPSKNRFGPSLAPGGFLLRRKA
ncbi:MAG: CmcI family methyltransferase [Thermoplasmata archaeon]